MNLIFLFIIAFVQNMAFTWVSRSRQGGDLKYHAVASFFSNAIWFACNFFILFPEILSTIQDGNVWRKILVMGIYVVATMLGSITMMAINLGRVKVPKFLRFLVETGKKQVGAR